MEVDIDRLYGTTPITRCCLTPFAGAYLCFEEVGIGDALWNLSYWPHEVAVASPNHLRDPLAYSDLTLHIEEHLSGFIHFSDDELCIKHDDALIDQVELGSKEVILAENTLQILNVEKDRAEQAAHVPEKPLLLAFLQVLSGKLRLVVVVCHDDCQGCSILFVKHRNSDRISDTSYFQLR